MVKVEKISRGQHRRMTVVVYDSEDYMIRSIHFAGNTTINDVIDVLEEEFGDKPFRYQCFLTSASSKVKLFKYSTKAVDTMKQKIYKALGLEKKEEDAE